MTAPNKRTIVAGAIGNALELYDFAVFGFFAPVISAQFFPADEPIAGLLKTFGIFAVGCLARPLGGILLGYLGDRIGRQRVLRISIIVMAVPTTLICILPTHEQIGVWAAGLLVLLRIVQGISVGGELVGSICYLVEMAPSGKRGLVGSYAFISATCGVLTGSAVAAIIHLTMSTETIAEWGWRLPFLGGLVLGFTGWRLRRGLLETPAFQEILTRGATVRHPTLHAIRRMPREILLAGLSVILMGVSFYTIFVWMPTYLSHIVAPPVSHAFLINTLAMILAALITPLGGYLSDRIGYKATQAGSMIALSLPAYPLFLLLDTGGLVAVCAAMAVFAASYAVYDGSIPITVAEQFPVEVRYSAMAVGYNISMAIFGGTAPFIATWLIKETGDLAAPAWYIAATGILSIVALLGLKGRYASSDPP